MTTIEVPLRWRDGDQLGHVYHGTVVTLLDQARSEWMLRLGLDDPVHYVIVHLDLDYAGEILVSDRVVAVDIELERVGRSSITTRETLSTARQHGCIEARCTVVHWDTQTRGSREISPADRGRLNGSPLSASRVDQ